MALVDALHETQLAQTTAHAEVECTYAIVTDEAGQRCLQLDTYGSRERQIVGKKSQSIRLTPNAIQQLKKILEENGL